jgi:hypothetical protein
VVLIESSGPPWTLKVHHTLYIKDDSFLLTVTGTDAAGNSSTETAEPYFRHRGIHWHWR